MHRMRTPFQTSLVALSVLVLAATAEAQVTVVVESGDIGPGGVVYRRLPRRPAVSDAAGTQVAFNATVRGGTSRLGIFADDDDATVPGTAIVLKDQPSPTGAQFTKFGVPSINAASRVAFSARMRASGAGVFLDGVSTVVLKLDDAPPAFPTFFASFDNAEVTDAGDVVFKATLGNAPTVSGVTADVGIFRCTGGPSPNCSSAEAGTGTLSAVVAVGDATGAGRTFCGLGDFDASDFGIALRASTKVDCTDGTEPAVDGIFRITYAGAVETLALVGNPSEPDPLSTTFYQKLNRGPAIANNGMVAFYGFIGAAASDGLFVCDPAVCPGSALPTLAVQAGVASAADQPADNDLVRLSAPGVSDAGDVVFRANLIGPAGRFRGLFVYRDASGQNETIALNGDVAPTQPPDPSAQFRSFRLPFMTSGGKVVFAARARGSSGSIRGIYLFQ